MLTQLNSTKRYSLVVLSFIVMFLFLFSASSTDVKAQVPPELQCPTNIPPTVGQPGYVGWTNKNGAFRYTSSYNCYADVWYCERFVNGVWQFFITKIDPIPSGSPCGDIPWSQIIEDVRNGVMKTKNADPCGPNNVTIQCEVYTGQCVRFYENGLFRAYLLFC